MRWLQELEDLFQIKIDKEQYQVITDEHLCLQVIAGAGSGKTFTICCKVYYLVYVKKVPAYKIVVLSYTNYACSEIQNYFKIDREKITENTTYNPKEKTYRYRPRGLHDAEQPYEPYPEVVTYEKQEDGTLRLFIEAVWERKMTDHAVTSELVVRPIEDGSYQYVSNQVTGWDENLELLWYTPRLTDEEWQYYYEN